MKDLMADLTAALRERVKIIRDEQSRRQPETHMKHLQAISEKIENLEAALSSSIDPRLAHYLERRSYEKALEFLEGAAPSAPDRSD
jgi:hypothetical protein